jgi:polysaccharide export outer membrane protein
MLVLKILWKAEGAIRMPTRLKLSRSAVILVLALAGLGAFASPGLSLPTEEPKAPPQDAQATSESPRANAAPPLQRRNPRYLIGSGDVLELVFQFTPEFDQTVTVQPDGFINLRSVGDLHVAGKTAPEVRKAIEQSYSKILREPVISVTLKEFEKPYFLAMGQVEKPGKYDIRGDTTVAEAVAMAGGFNGKAKHSQVLVFRRSSSDWVEVKEINLKRMLNSGDLREDVQVQPGDMVYVPQSRISKITPYIPFPSLGFYMR